jgi:hypothetical protein
MLNGSLGAAVGAADDHRGLDAVEVGSSAAERVRHYVEVVNAALADRAVADRVAQAGVLVRLDFGDRPVQPVFLCFDVMPPFATTEPQPRRADVTLGLNTIDLSAYLRQGEQLPLRILSGEVRFEGPVRKFLRVLPVLRAALHAQELARENS